MMRRRFVFLIGLALFVLLGPGQGMAQDGSEAQRFFPRQGFMLSGYGAAGYNATFGDNEHPNTFAAGFSPIMLFQVSDRFLFEGELEFAIEEGITETDLEYAQIDASLTDNLTLVAGKFLLPFNTFSERYHPTWINRFASLPPLYGGHGGGGPADPMLPILADFGVQLRGAFTVGRFSTFTAEAFVTQGPALAAEEHMAGTDGEAEEHGDVAFGSTAPDNNEDKMVGGRVGFGVAPYFEANVSAMTGAYDAEGDLRFSALGVHMEGRYHSFTLHGEYIHSWQDLADHDEPAAKAGALSTTLQEGAMETLSRDGYWVQLGYRQGNWQPVLRWTQLFEGTLEGETVTESGRQLALGLDYWFEPALVVKVEYLINDEQDPVDNNRVAIQLAFGF